MIGREVGFLAMSLALGWASDYRKYLLHDYIILNEVSMGSSWLSPPAADNPGLMPVRQVVLRNHYT